MLLWKWKSDRRDFSLFLCRHLDHHKATLAESWALHGKGLGGSRVSLVEVIVVIMVGHPETSIWNKQTQINRQLHSLDIRQGSSGKSKDDFNQQFQVLSFMVQDCLGLQSKGRVVRAAPRQQSRTLSKGTIVYAGLPFSCLHVLPSGRAQPLKTTAPRTAGLGRPHSRVHTKLNKHSSTNTRPLARNND